MQSPSSLIFLVLLGVWAAYFVQYWVRRRDHVATARSVEQFSTAMRVLERREALPRTDLSEPAPRSYAVHPARSVRPQVTVKRAVAAEMPAPVAVTERIDRAAPAATRPEPGRAAPLAPRRVAPPQVSPSRKVRGLFFLVAVAELVAIVPLVATSLLPLWALAPAVGAVVAALAFVRSGARTQAALTRAHRRRLADLERVRAAAPVTARPARPATARPAPAAPVQAATAPAAPATAAHETASVFVEDEVVAGSLVEPVVEVAPVEAPAPVAVPAPVAAPAALAVDHAPEIAVQAPARAAVADDVMVPIEVDDDIPLTWDPVPVPRPTYTMKAKAEHPPVPPAAVTPEPAPAVRDDETAYEHRRVAGA